MKPKRYATAAAFRRALEDRLQEIARKEGVDLQRLRRQVAFDRFLARLFQVGEPLALPWALKGGYAMELRIKAARTTKDIDLTMRGVLSPGEKKDDKKNLAVLEKLQESAALSSDDFFVYTIGEPISDLDAAPYGGARFPVEARLNGRVFVGFHVDVGMGDVVMEPLEVIEGRDWLGFAGIASPSLYMIPREQQFAEKLHAYTLPRKGAANTRVRDLVDMVLLIQSTTLARNKVTDAIRVTFERRKTHSMPSTLPAPPADWQKPYEALARECGLSGQVECLQNTQNVCRVNRSQLEKIRKGAKSISYRLEKTVAQMWGNRKRTSPLSDLQGRPIGSSRRVKVSCRCHATCAKTWQKSTKN